MATALVALGSNLGDRTENLAHALRTLGQHPAIRVAAWSRWYFTAPVGGPLGQGEFVNAAARLETTLPPDPLLAVLREVEATLGRERRERWAARVVDLDLLLYDDLVINAPGLQVPHPRMAFRRFVLEPAAEIASDLRHPLIGWSLGRLLTHLNTARNYVALVGVPGIRKTELAQRVADDAAGQFWRDPASVLLAERARDQTGSSPLAFEREVLRRRTEFLSLASWPDTEQAIISDFWIGQGLAHGRLKLDVSTRAEFEAEWAACQNATVPPKVLVLLHAPSGTLPELHVQLRELVVHGGHGLFLELDVTQPDWALAELKALIEAMR